MDWIILSISTFGTYADENPFSKSNSLSDICEYLCEKVSI
jgi:hypothetical protein